MIEDAFVIDAVAHSYNFREDNAVDPHIGEAIRQLLVRQQRAHTPEEYWQDEDQHREGNTPDLLASAFFAESYTDFAAYHHTPIYGYFKDGGSALSVGQELKRRYPDRTMLYGAVAPLRPGALDAVDELASTGATAIKLYPADLVDGRMVPLDMGDPETCFPVFERARERGIKVIAVHKALPLGPAPLDAMRSRDVEYAALAFPDLIFEVVHGGMAFVEETAVQLETFRNIVVNLETTSALAASAPHRFLEAIGRFLLAGGEDRIVWATGCNAMHPRPLIEAFWNLEMPDSLREDWGLPELTREIKTKILGANFAAMHGLDIAELQRRTADDPFHPGVDMAPPWSSSVPVGEPA